MSLSRSTSQVRRPSALSPLVAALLASSACTVCADPAPGNAAHPPPALVVSDASAVPVSASRAPTPRTPLLAAPFDALGPFRIGMSEAEARAALPALVPGPIPSWLVADGYELRFVDGTLKTVRVQLADVGGLVVGDRELGPTADLMQVASYFQGCSAPEERTGASIVRCEREAVTVLAGGVSRTVYVGIGETRPSP